MSNFAEVTSIQYHIVILTKHREALLKKCLQSLTEAKLLPGTQILILINGFDPGSEKLVQEFESALPLQIINLEKEVTPAAARNSACEYLTGKWVCFLDDDVEVPKDYFQTFERLESTYPNALVIGGPNLTPTESNLVQVVTGEMMASQWGSAFCSNRYRMFKHPEGWVNQNYLILCNMWMDVESFKRNVFPEHFLCGEENKVLASLDQNKFVASKDLFVWHHRRSEWISFFKQVRKYAIGRGQNLYHGKANWFHLVPTFSLVGLLLDQLKVVDLSSLVILYFLLNLFFALKIGFRLRTISSFSLSFLAFPIHHLVYALGVPEGWVRELKFSKQTKVQSSNPSE